MDEVDDLDAKVCPKCHKSQIKQEIDEVWYCENCDKPHGHEKPIENDVDLRLCVNCGKNSGIFEYCKDCRPKD